MDTEKRNSVSQDKYFFFVRHNFYKYAVEIDMEIGSRFFGKNPMKQVPKGIPRSVRSNG